MARANTTLSAGAAVLPVDIEERSAPRHFRTLRVFLTRKPLGVFGAAIVLVLVVLAIFAPLIAPYNPATIFIDTRSQAAAPNVDCTANPFAKECLSAARGGAAAPLQKAAPSWKHMLGTDELGRDIWSRIVYGARRSLGVGVISLALGTAAGVILGGLSAYFGGTLDTIVQRIMDTLQAFPALLFLILITSVGQPDIRVLTLGIAVVATPQISRIVRSTVLQVRELPFVEAADVIGAPHYRIMLSHILPNIWAPVIVVFTIGVGAGILGEAALSFLGIAPVGISWGFMTAAGVAFIRYAPGQAIFGGLAISLAVLGFNLVGDALRDVLDPRLRAR